MQQLIRSGEHSHYQLAAEVYSLLARTIVRMLDLASDQTKVNRALLFGGVAASDLLKQMVHERLKKRHIHIHIDWADPALSGDNAVGAALIGLNRKDA